MNRDEIAAKVRERMAGTLEESDLVYVRTSRVGDCEWRWYVCPCGSDEHYAGRPMVSEGLSQSPGRWLTCFKTELQWFVRRTDVEGVIREEEEAYLRLLDAAPAIVAKVVKKRGCSEETIAFLEDTHGIDRDISEEIMRKERAS